MGEAKRKIDADACGIPRPRDNKCPACGSRRIVDMAKADAAGVVAVYAGIDCDWQGCRDCKAVWEAFPAVYVRDPVCAEPCDNCAFRPGSPEQKDPESWKGLIAKLKPTGDLLRDGQFYCHKGIPIDMANGPGNFLFPQTPVLMDGKPVRNPADGSIVTTEDTSKMRACSGWLRMVWAHAAKATSNN